MIDAEIRQDLAADMTVVTMSGRLGPAAIERARTVIAQCVAQCPTTVVADVRALDGAKSLTPNVFRQPAGPERDLPAVALVVVGGRADGAGSDVAVVPTMDAALGLAARRRLSTARMVLPLSGDMPYSRRAGEFTTEACRDWDIDSVAPDSRLLVTELVANAVTHAGAGVELELVTRGPFLHIRVRDASTSPPRPDRRPAFGLRLVEIYSSGWGWVTDAAGKVVWATLRTRPTRRAGWY